MGKERRLEKKIKELEVAALTAEAAGALAERMVAAMESAKSVSASSSVSPEREKKPRKKRAKKTEEAPKPVAKPVLGASVSGSVPESSADLTPSASSITDKSEADAPLTITELARPTKEDAPGTDAAPNVSGPEAGIPMAEARVADMPPVLEPPSLERKVEMIADVLYEVLTDQMVTLKALREAMAGIVSEDCQKNCEARMRKRARPSPHSGASTPKKRKLTGFQIFCQAKRLEATPVKHAFSELGRLWKELTEEEKEKYKKEAERVAMTEAVAAGQAHDLHEIAPTDAPSDAN